jgi:hypothetical protein
MKTELAYFNVFPKIFVARREGFVSIAPRGLHSRFEEGRPYAVTVVPMRDTILNEEGSTSRGHRDLQVRLLSLGMRGD